MEIRSGSERLHLEPGLFQTLHDQHKQIKIESDHRADDVNPAPCSAQMLGTAGENRNREKRQRNNPKTNRWREPVKRKKESSDRCQNGSGQEPFRPAIRSEERRV